MVFILYIYIGGSMFISKETTLIFVGINNVSTIVVDRNEIYSLCLTCSPQ